MESLSFFSKPQARMGLKGCRLIGYLRIVFCVIVLYDRWLMGLDLQDFFSPTTGIAPITLKTVYERRWEYSLLEIFPESDLWLWIVWAVGTLNVVLLMLGVAPRWNALMMHMNNLSIRRTTHVFWDGEDVLLCVAGFYTLLLPLHHITVYDRFGTKPRKNKKQQPEEESLTTTSSPSARDDNKEENEAPASEETTAAEAKKDSTDDDDDDEPVSASTNEHVEKVKDKKEDDDDVEDSWPMWPVWLVNLEMVLLYLGALVAKLDDITNSDWVNGTAMFYVTHLVNGLYGGPFAPDALFNNLFTLKIMCWATLFIEAVAPITLWNKRTKIPTYIAIMALHLGIETSMNLHMFQPMTMWGWTFCFVEPDAKVTQAFTKAKWQRMLEWAVFAFLAFTAISFCIPTDYIPAAFPKNVSDAVAPFVQFNDEQIWSVIAPPAMLLGYFQFPFLLFGAGQEGGGCEIEVEARLKNNTLVTLYESSDWANIPWWERKRHFRTVNFGCKMLGCEYCTEPVRFVQQIANKTTLVDLDDVVTIEIWEPMRSAPRLLNPDYENIYDAPDYRSSQLQWWQAPKEMGWFGPARLPLIEEPTEFFLRVLPCRDTLDSCQRFAIEGGCVGNFIDSDKPPNKDGSLSRYMTKNCPRSCGLCTEDQALWDEEDPTDWYEIRVSLREQKEEAEAEWPPPCIDHDKDCDSWVFSERMCEGDKEGALFLRQVCPMSCGECEVQEYNDSELWGDDNDEWDGEKGFNHSTAPDSEGDDPRISNEYGIAMDGSVEENENVGIGGESTDLHGGDR